jgi:uncharacterized protein
MKYEILDRGSFLAVDKNGCLASSIGNKIQEPYSNAIKSIISVYQSVFNDKIHSIYVRGSVARGNPILGFSDFDCFAVILEEVSILQTSLIRKGANELLSEFSFVSSFDLSFFTLKDLLSNDDFMHWKFAIKIQSVCIFGQDLIQDLPNFKPTSEIIFSLANLEKRINKAKQQIFKLFEPKSTKYWCSWVMRSIVRSGFELVIEKERKYTNELSLCCKIFSIHYPERAKQMDIALNLAINPIINIEKIISIGDDLGGWLVTERIHTFGK